jgi:hypothetical protein
MTKMTGISGSDMTGNSVDGLKETAPTKEVG